ncbi:hypothetical protein [Campylobacter ureolyticus]|uniref:hypothetical protein n=1 Tax=Campylobacter ureolyticus TaxID=827 RepID=UPI0022B2CF82|nr:hypothetical protein [Campylobacter ureolyticus]MCZ6111627.1 hypothetical protein [Campylobacter ureolyticus]MDK8323209.1 hypothetical protein [Campylobacter ureolyticus]
MKNQKRTILSKSQNIKRTENFNVKYSEKELADLKKFVETIKNDESRATLACWGDYADYSKGY